MRYRIAWLQARAGEEALKNVSENRGEEVSKFASEAASLVGFLERLVEYEKPDAELGVWKFVVPEFGEDGGK